MARQAIAIRSCSDPLSVIPSEKEARALIAPDVRPCYEAASVTGSVPVSLHPRLAGLVALLDGIKLWLLWNHPWLWIQVAALVPFLSATGAAAVSSLLLVLGPVRCFTRIGRRDLGLSTRQLLVAALTGGAVWVCNQTAQLIDIAWTGREVSISRDISGAFLSAYSEEVLFRLVLIGGAMTLLKKRMHGRRTLVWAVLVSGVVFAISHVPHDLSTGHIDWLERYPALLAFAGLMASVYLLSGNLMLAALLHMLVNEPALLVAGPHVGEVTVVVTWTASFAVIARYAWRPNSARGAAASGVGGRPHAAGAAEDVRQEARA